MPYGASLPLRLAREADITRKDAVSMPYGASLPLRHNVRG